MTSSCFWNRSLDELKNVLVNSNYPSRLINEVIRSSCKKLGSVFISSAVGKYKNWSLMPLTSLFQYFSNNQFNQTDNIQPKNTFLDNPPPFLWGSNMLHLKSIIFQKLK